MIEIVREGDLELLEKQNPKGPTYRYGAICCKCGCMFRFSDESADVPTLPGYSFVSCPNPECKERIYSWDWKLLNRTSPIPNVDKESTTGTGRH